VSISSSLYEQLCAPVDLLMLLGATGIKAVRKYVGEIEPRFHSGGLRSQKITPENIPKRTI